MEMADGKSGAGSDAMRGRTRFDLALERATRRSPGIETDAKDARHSMTVPVNCTPIAVAFGPGDASQHGGSQRYHSGSTQPWIYRGRIDPR